MRERAHKWCSQANQSHHPTAQNLHFPGRRRRRPEMIVESFARASKTAWSSASIDSATLAASNGSRRPGKACTTRSTSPGVHSDLKATGSKTSPRSSASIRTIVAPPWRREPKSSGDVPASGAAVAAAPPPEALLLLRLAPDPVAAAARDDASPCISISRPRRMSALDMSDMIHKEEPKNPESRGLRDSRYVR